MHDLPSTWGALCALSFVLGLRHGLDADHLAAIDGLTRMGTRQGHGHARYSGALFSLGHGVVVMLIALTAGALGANWAPPAWFDTLGGLISIAFLALIGVVNLRAVLRAPSHAAVPLVTVRGRFVDRLLGSRGRRADAGGVMGVGALFALSFDTLSQSALFAVLAVQFGGVAHALVLGGLFVLGMLVSDGLNGWWMSTLIGRTDRRAVLASRIMTLAVASVSLLVAALGAARMLSGRFDGVLEGHDLAVGLSVIGLIALSYLIAMRTGPRVALSAQS